MKLWGWTSRRTTLQEGVFHSPAAGCGAPYRLIEERRWPTVLFVPMIPFVVRTVFVECQLTGARFDPRVLDQLSDDRFVELLPSAVRAAVAAVALADDVVTDDERRVALAVIREFVPDYDVVDFEADLEDVGIAPLEKWLARLSLSLNEHGKERILVCVAHVMSADGAPKERTVREVRLVGLALGMSVAHIQGVILQVEAAA